MKRAVIVVCIFYALLILCACSDDPKKAAFKELERRKIPFTEQKFLEKTFEGDQDAIKQFLTAGINREARTPDEGYTSLMIAAHAGHKEIISMLLQSGADVNAVDNTGVTALMRAALNGYTDCARVLLEKGADPDIQAEKQKGMTALMYAASSGHTSAVKLLLEKGANPDIRSAEGNQALMFAQLSGNPSTVEVLSSASSNINTPNDKQINALHMLQH